MLKRILSLFILIALLLTATSCRSTKDVYSVDSEYEQTVSLYDSTSEDATESDKTTSETSSQNKTESKTDSKDKTSTVVTPKPSVSSSKPSGSATHTHSYNTATCTEPEKCTVCGETKGKPIEHTYYNGVCMWCLKDQNGFVRYYPYKGIEITEDELNKIFSQEYTKPKNVIFMIGDGMGPNDIILGEKFGKNLADYGFAFNKIPNNGLAITDSLDGTTDSAASATALATGTKTKNGYIGVDQKGKNLTNISEIARECGKKVGIVTNDSYVGATPSAFFVHNISRNNGIELSTAALTFAPDVLIGARSSYLENTDPALLEKFFITEQLYDMNNVLNANLNTNKPYFGILHGGHDNLSLYTNIALSKLKNENGFFLMIENTATDTAGHSNNVQGKIDAVRILDQAVLTVLDFMRNNPDTLLIITSDHETGGLQLPTGDNKPTDSLFTTTGHTSTKVRVFALGYGAEYFNGKTVDNTDIAKFAINAVKGNW